MRSASNADLVDEVEANLNRVAGLSEALLTSASPEDLADLSDILGAGGVLLQRLRGALDGTPLRSVIPELRLVPPTAAPAEQSEPAHTSASPALALAPAPQALPDAEVIERWRQHLAAASFASNTLRIRVSHLKRLAAKWPGLCSMTTHQLEQFMADFSNTNGAASMKTFQSSIRSFYAWALGADLVTTDPTRLLLKVRVPRVEGRTVTDEKVEAGLRLALPAERAMILLGREAGLRREEIASLKVTDLEGQTLRVHGKGGKVRRVPVTGRLRNALEAIRPDATTYFFPGRVGAHIHVDSVHEAISRTVGVNPHALRHAAANSAYARTRDIQAVAAFLGHSSIATTQTYLHLHDSQMQALAAAVALSD